MSLRHLSGTRSSARAIEGLSVSAQRCSRTVVVRDRHLVAHTHQEPFRLFIEGLSAQGNSNEGFLVVAKAPPITARRDRGPIHSFGDVSKHLKGIGGTPRYPGKP